MIKRMVIQRGNLKRVRPEAAAGGGGGGWYKGRARRSHRLVTSRRPTLLVPPASPIFLFNHGESSLFLITGQKRVKKSVTSQLSH